MLVIRQIYTFLLYLFLPFILLRLYWKGRYFPEYRTRIGERFACHTQAQPVDVWLHGASLGELVAASPLIDALLSKSLTIMVTTMTPTGSEHVQRRFGNKVQHQYVPYDYPWVLRRFFKAIHPKLGIIMETELWPNLVTVAKQNHLRLLLVNARISEPAFQQYLKVRWFIASILSQFDGILTQSHEDAVRYRALGAPAQRVHMVGNIKFDQQFTLPANPEYLQCQAAWGQKTVLIAASTHDNEEAQLLSILPMLKAAIPNLLLLIAPRHPQRFQAVYQLALARGFNAGLRSQLDHINAAMDVIVLDSMGELLGFYSVSQWAFVGGSLIPLGGHNVLEPLGMNIPTLVGPYMNNSKSIVDDLTFSSALIQVNNKEALAEAIVTLHQNPMEAQAQVAAASRVLEANRGCLQRYLEHIDVQMGIT